MKKILVILIFIMTPTFLELDCHAQQDRKLSVNGYVLTTKEITLMRSLVYEDIICYANGNESLKEISKFYPPRLSIEVLQRDYNANEVKADIKYRNKCILLYGVIASISRGLGDIYYLLLSNGINAYNNVHVAMADGFVEYLATLEKGRSITLYCKVHGMMLGTVAAEDCLPIQNWAETALDEVCSGITTEAENKEIESMKIVFYFIGLSQVVPDGCYQISDKIEFAKCVQRSKAFEPKVLSDPRIWKNTSEKLGYDLETLKTRQPSKK